MALYIISILVAWIFAIISIISNARSRQNIWLAVIMVISSFMGIGYIIIEISKDLNGSIADLTEQIGSLILVLSYYIYYPYLNFAFYSSGFFKNNKFIMRYFPIFTIIPTILIAFTDPLSTEYTEEAIPLMIWKNTYVIIGIVLLTMALYKNRRNGEMINHFKTFIFIVPTVLILFVLNDLAFICGHPEMSQYDSYIIIYFAIVFCIFAIKDGYLGMHIRLERTKMQGSMETLNLATAFITHDFKNEVVKMVEFTDKIRNTYPDGIKKIESQKWFDLMDSSRIKIQEMFKKMKSNATDGITLEIKRYKLKEVIEQALNFTSYYEVNPNILDINVPENMLVECDFNYTARVFSNIIDNAYESLLENSNINIYAYGSGKYNCTVIQDNGRGVSKYNLGRVFKPFFSTKTLKYNLGLGLAYCYDIINMSKGRLVITSKEGKGTRVFVYLVKSSHLYYKRG